MPGQVLTFFLGQVCLGMTKTKPSPTEPTATLTPEQQGARDLSMLGASKGGKARASVLTPEQRSSIAREAVRARWIKAGKLKDVIAESSKVKAKQGQEAAQPPSLPFSMFRGKVQFGPIELECHVLNDGRRVFTQGEMVRAITGGTESSNLARYLRRNPLIEEDFSGGPIRFQVPGNPRVSREVCSATSTSARGRGVCSACRACVGCCSCGVALAAVCVG